MKQLLLTILAGLLTFAISAQPRSYLQVLNEKYTSGLFRSDNAYMLIPMEDNAAISALNVFQYMQGRVPGLLISQNRFQRPVISYRLGYPALFLNEMRVDASTLMSINMNDIALIKIFRSPFVGAPGGGANGAIAVYTKDGDEAEIGEVE